MTDTVKPTQADVEIWRQREVQAIGAAISTRNWHDLETAYNALRDKMDAVLHTPEWVTIPARDGIEAQQGLNDVFPGDPVKVRGDATGRIASQADLLDAVREARTALQAMMDAWLDYHDAHSLTQPVTGAAGNAFDKALAARDKLDSLLSEQVEP